MADLLAGPLVDLPKGLLAGLLAALTADLLAGLLVSPARAYWPCAPGV